MQASGFVLAGGGSTRMGRNKALLPLHGSTLVEHIAGIVREAAGSVTLIGDPVQLGHLGLPVVPDRLPGRGPVSGIYTALTITSGDWNLIAGCDMPALTCEILLDLLRRAAAVSHPVDCLAATGPDGEPEPLCDVYHRRCLPAGRGRASRGAWRATPGRAGACVRHGVGGTRHAGDARRSRRCR